MNSLIKGLVLSFLAVVCGLTSGAADAQDKDCSDNLGSTAEFVVKQQAPERVRVIPIGSRPALAQFLFEFAGRSFSAAIYQGDENQDHLLIIDEKKSQALFDQPFTRGSVQLFDGEFKVVDNGVGQLTLEVGDRAYVFAVDHAGAQQGGEGKGK